MKITTGLTPSVRKWVLPAGSAHITLGGVALALPTSESDATLIDRVDLFVLEFATSADSVEAHEGTAQSFTLLGSEPVIEKRGIEFARHPDIPAFNVDHEAHLRRKFDVPDDAAVIDEPHAFSAHLRKLRWYEVTI